MKSLIVIAMVVMSGTAAAQRQGVIGKEIPNTLGVSTDARERKLEAEERFTSRLEAIEMELSDLSEVVEARAPNGEMIDTSLANAEEQLAAAEVALNEFKNADEAEWSASEARMEDAFRALDASMARAEQEVLAH